MQGFPTRAEVKRIKAQFPEGTMICCDYMPDDPQPIPPGTIGEVKGVDDAGQLLMRWSNGRSLSLIPGVDSFHIIQPAEDMEQPEDPEIDESQGISIDL